MDIFFFEMRITLSLVNSTFIANPVSECLGPSLSYPGDGIHLLALNEGRGLIRVGTVDGRYPIRNARTLNAVIRISSGLQTSRLTRGVHSVELRVCKSCFLHN